MLQVRERRATPARWRAALDRAVEHGLEVFVVADTGERLVTSASRLDTLHRTDGRSCTCEAAVGGDPVCSHRAAVRCALGWVLTPGCEACAGTGRDPECKGHKTPTGRVVCECEACGGTGLAPVSALQAVA